MKTRTHPLPGARCLSALVLLFASLTAPIEAATRSSGAYIITADSLDAGGQSNSSAAYVQQGDLGAVGASSSSAGYASNGGIVPALGTGDTVTGAPTLNAPTPGSANKNPVSISFNLPEAAKPGTVTLTLAGTTTVALTLTGTAETVGAHSFTFNPASPVTTTPPGLVVSPANTIPDGTYTVTLSYQDVLGNTAATASAAGVRVDTVAPQVTALAPQIVLANPNGDASMPDLKSALLALSSDNQTTLTVANIAQSPAAGAPLTLGIVVVNFTVTDAAGNSTQSTTTVRVTFPHPNGTVVQVGGEVGAAVTGKPAPGAGSGGLPAGALLGTFGPPAISDFRDLAAQVTLTSGKTKLRGIYVEDHLGVGLIPAFEGGPVPGPTGVALPNLTFKKFLDPVMAPGGAIAFGGTLKGDKQDDGVWTDAFGGVLKLALREGSDVPGLATGVKLKSVTSISLQDGELLALVKLAAAKGLVSSGKDDIALVRITGIGTGNLLLRTGADFSGDKIKTIAVLAPALGSAGQGRWHAADAVGAKLTLTNKHVFVVSVADNGTVTTLVRAGENDPGLNVTLSKLGIPSLPTGGHLAVAGTVTPVPGATPDTANKLFFSAAPPALVAAVSGGSAAIGADVFYSSFFDPVSNDDGVMLFLATLRGNGVKGGNKSGLWTFDSANSSRHLVARLGDPAQGKDGMNLTDTTWAGFSSYALPDGVDPGPVFLATLGGKGVKSKDKTGLWAVDSNGTLRLLLRTNEEVTLGVNTKKTLASMTLLNAPSGVFGARRSYNSTGSLAVLATFTDKTQALLRVDIP